MRFNTSLQVLLDRDTYRSYLDRLDARALLDHYGARNATEQHNKDGTTEIVHSCLLDRVEPHHTNGDANPSASCNIDKKTYVCYSMGFGCDLFHLVMKLEGKEEFSEALGEVRPFLTGVSREGVELQAEFEKLFHTQGYSLELPHYDDRILRKWQAYHPYLAQRGVTAEAVETLRLGYDPLEHRVVFPLFVDGTLVGWQKRVLPAGPGWHATVPDYPKYRNSSGFPKSETIYNLDAASAWERTCVVESPMSVARAVSVGIPNVVGTHGAKVSQAQVDLLKRFKVVYVWFDADNAGVKGERILVEGLYRHCEVEVVTPDGGRDMGDCSLEEIAVKLENATPAAIRRVGYPRRK